MNGMNADEDTDEENENSLKAKGFWYYPKSPSPSCQSSEGTGMPPRRENVTLWKTELEE